MKKTTLSTLAITLTVTSLFFVSGTSCSSDKPSSSEETTAPAEENTTVEEPAPVEADTTAQNEDQQANDAPAQAIQPPEDKEPVLTMMSTSYKEWNEDGNNVLDKEEFYRGLYQVWDKDGDSQISDQEFTEGANNFFADYNFKEYGQYADWDSDSNGQLSVAEFREGMKSTVDQEPTAQELLVIWDTDNDDAIERIELDNITVRLDEDSN